jgi:O-antigen/teichoic acid export membrane protein
MVPSVSSTDVAHRAVRSTAISLVGQLATQLLRFASTIVLARFLPESAFGVNAIVASLTLGLWMVSDVGIPASILKSERDDDAFVSTAWTLSLVRGGMLLVAGCVLGVPAAWLYDEPQLLWLMPLGSLMIFFVAAESTRIYSATRTMQIGRVVGLEVSAQVIALSVSIPTAIATGHVIAFVVGAAASGLVKLVLSHLVLPGSRVRIVWDGTATSEILSFGKWIFLSTLCAYVAVRWDIFALGRLEGMALLGVYGLANQITSVPHQMAMHATGNVLTPVLADAFRSSKERFRERLAMARRAYIPVALLLFVGAATTAPAFFILAFKQGFHAAGPMAQALMVQAWFDFLQEASSRSLLARGDGRGLALTNALKLVATIVGTYVGLQLWGFWGFVWGNACGGLVGIVAVGLRLRGQGLPEVLWADLQAAAVLLLVLAVSCGVPVLLQDSRGWPAAWTTLVGCMVVCGPVGLIVLRRIREARASLAAHASAMTSAVSSASLTVTGAE